MYNDTRLLGNVFDVNLYVAGGYGKFFRMSSVRSHGRGHWFESSAAQWCVSP